MTKYIRQEPFSNPKSANAASRSASFLTPDCFRRTWAIHWAKQRLLIRIESISAWKASSITRVRFSRLDLSRGWRLSENSERPPRGLWPLGLRKPRGVWSADAERPVRTGFENFGGINRLELQAGAPSNKRIKVWTNFGGQRFSEIKPVPMGRSCPAIVHMQWTLWAERLQTQIFLRRKFTPQSTSWQKHSLKCLHRKTSTHYVAQTKFQWPMLSKTPCVSVTTGIWFLETELGPPLYAAGSFSTDLNVWERMARPCVSQEACHSASIYCVCSLAAGFRCHLYSMCISSPPEFQCCMLWKREAS